MVGLGELVSCVAEHLHLGREATHRVAAEHETLTREAAGRVRPVAAVIHAIDAVSRVVELDGVDIDLTASRVEQHDGHRQLSLRHLVTLLAEFLDEQRHVPAGDDEIEVVVLPRLLAEQRVDTPATVQPDGEPTESPGGAVARRVPAPSEIGGRARRRPALSTALVD